MKIVYPVDAMVLSCAAKALHYHAFAAAAAKFQARLGGDLTLPNPLAHLPASHQTQGHP